MTYIKWKDEVESYLGRLPEGEKQKVFSYFAEMYADKRDAGLSEESIIESFGAPYDVAQRILADSKDSAPSQTAENNSGNSGSSGNSGGNNYNYNYYNYNYGGAPPSQPAPSNGGGAPPSRPAPSSAGGKSGNKGGDVDVSDIDMPLPEGTPKPKDENNGGKNAAVTVILTIVFIIAGFALVCTGVGFTIGIFSTSIGFIASGSVSIIGAGVGLATGLGKAQIGLMGSGFIELGIGIILLPLSIFVVKLLWKFISWALKQFKETVKA